MIDDVLESNNEDWYVLGGILKIVFLSNTFFISVIDLSMVKVTNY